ncbi:MAG: hypothetical protein JST88_11140 [Bacteroidetes bacterium]|nr:hypothetical protein [Bacteroidota bacterium]
MKRFIAATLLGLALTGCNKKTNDDNSAAGTNFTSYQQWDINGQRLGNVGDVSDEYRMEDWPDWVYNIFKPLDTANLTGYNWSEVVVDRLYPNPCGNTQFLRTFATQPINLKLALIDPSKKVYLLKSMELNSAQHDLQLNYTNLGMTTPSYYRLFYTFSAAGKPYFQRGHIDIYKTQQ